MTSNETLKNAFVGTWKGTDHGSLDKNETNHWSVIRTDDCKFYVEFTTYFKDGSVEKSQESGLWFVDEEFFYEQREGEEQADVYTYQILSDKIIRFKDIISNYQFTDELVLPN